MGLNEFDIMPQVNYDIAWCPGCGNFAILKLLQESLIDLTIKPQNLVMVSGIGQAAKTPHYLRTNFFNGLHGRSLPVAMGIKAANPSLTVIAESGDGCMYGEGGNHFQHTILRNPDIKMFVHNNMVYGLTKGQASPTSQMGFVTPVQPRNLGGYHNSPLNPLAVAISLDASFVARIFINDKEQSKQILKQALQHKGFALVDIFQPCVTFNKINTYQWFTDHTYYLDENHDVTNRIEALKHVLRPSNSTDHKLPLGIFYVNSHKPVFSEASGAYQDNPEPLFKRSNQRNKLENLLLKKQQES